MIPEDFEHPAPKNQVKDCCETRTPSANRPANSLTEIVGSAGAASALPFLEPLTIDRRFSLEGVIDVPKLLFQLTVVAVM